MKKPVCLIIRDGWGKGEDTDNNAIFLANPTFANRIEKEYPTTLVKTSGLAVGLPEGVMGNSEAGHLNIGAGRVVFQSLTRINLSIKNDEFRTNPEMLKAIEFAKINNSRIHIMGLVQDAGVHATTDHALEIIKTLKEHDLSDVLIHAFTDGRDTPTHSGINHLKYLQDGLDNLGIGRIATIVGRYYAMDRDNRMDRTNLAYNMLVSGAGEQHNDYVSAINSAYEAGETDEFVTPKVIDYNGIKDDDVVFFFNYRPDRCRQLTHLITENLNVYFVGMTEYYEEGKFHVLYPEVAIKNNLGEVISNNGLKQLRCAETEKYAHVTYFFNSLEDEPYKMEDRKLVNSPDVKTYDLKPEMSAYEVKETILNALDQDTFDIIICNFANCDMVGHTAVKEAVIQAVKTVDECVEEVSRKALEMGGIALIMADHGNAEELRYPNGEPMTSHTTNDVPLTILGMDNIKLKDGGKLADIAPTILEIMNLEKPKEMTGESLIIKN